eukprot:11624933-Ditylum_brightwellii.AAC.2
MDQVDKLGAWDHINENEVPYVFRVRYNVIEGTWVFKVKRTPNRVVKKRKARLCVRGDQQVKDVDNFETLAPVVSWNTVHTIMTLVVILGLKS